MSAAMMLGSWLRPFRRPARRLTVNRPSLTVEQLESRELLSTGASLLAGLNSPGAWKFVVGVYRDRFGRMPRPAQVVRFLENGGQGAGTPASLSLLGRSHHTQTTHQASPRVRPALDMPAGSGGWYFDFGGSNTPVAPGYVGLAPVGYSASRGYGWANASAVSWTSRKFNNPLECDFHWGTDDTFLVNLPNGTYNVTPTLGDAKAAHGQESIYLQGQQVAAGLSTAAGQFIAPTYQVTVTNGQLQFRITGGSSYFALDGLKITIGAPPVASAGPGESGKEGSAVTFAGSVQGGITPYSETWDFGDGTTASGTLTPSHTYTTDGNYTVTLTVTDGTGRTSTSTTTASVAEAPPAVTITGAPSASDTGVALSLGSTVTDPGGQTAGFTYAWSVTDNGIPITSGSGPTLALTPNTAGTYVVTLAASDNDGGTGSTSTTVVVNAPPVASAGLPAIGTAGSAVAFAGTVLGGTAPYTETWDFGDGTTASATLAPSHTYTTAGNYNVTLTATDAAGVSSSSTTTATIAAAPPSVTITGAPAATDTGVAVSLGSTVTDPSGQTTGFIYAWSVTNNGIAVASSSSSTLKGTPTVAGTYLVNLAVSDNGGGKGTASKTIVINPPPVANAGPAASGTAGSAVAFAGSVQGGTTPYLEAWDFGDGAIASATLTPSHSYSSAGTYTVTLTVTDAAGISNSSTTTANIAAPATTTVGNSAVFMAQDPVTEGTWIGNYGADGYNVIGASASYPSYAQVTPAGQQSLVWAGSTTDPRGLQVPGNPTNRTMAAWYASTSFTVNVTISDGQAHQVALYLLDADHQGRSEQIDVLDSATGAVLDTRTVSSFANGEYLFWNISGSVTFRFTTLAGPNAVLSGLFFDPVWNSGLNIPQAHPRIWWTPARLVQAQQWYTAHPFTPDPTNPLDNAFVYVLTGNTTYAQNAINALMNFTISDTELQGVASDNYRWNDWVPVVYDWCYNQMTPDQISTFTSRYNYYTSTLIQKPWGGPTMPASNYFWGYWRNELNWAIASYYNNPSAQNFLADALLIRWQKAFLPYAASAGNGGVPAEGSQYGRYMLGYPVVPMETADLLGRDLFTEKNFYNQAAYYLLYSTSPGPVANRAGTSSYYQVFPFGDDEQSYGYPAAADQYYADFMTTLAGQDAGTPLGGYIRQWLAETGAAPSDYVAAVDQGGTAQALTSLPTDYYAPGPGYLYAKDGWGAGAESLEFLLGADTGGSHSHLDSGSFQILRNGYWLTKGSTGYSSVITGYGGAGTVSTSDTLATNGIEVGGLGQAASYPNGLPTVTRLESQPGYTFASVDLSATYQSSDSRFNNPNVQSVVRDFVYVRALDTLVVFDRVATSAAGTPMTFLLHFPNSPTVQGNTVTGVDGNQALVMTNLTPASQPAPTFTVVNEQTSSTDSSTDAQYRVEETTTGQAQGYMINVLQAKDASAGNVTATLTENTTTFTITLTSASGQTAVLTFAKGMTSTGGTFAYSASGTPTASTPLTSSVESIHADENGVTWGP